MTTKFQRPVYRETTHATVMSRGARPIVVGLIDGDLIELRLKGERHRVYVAASTVFYHALALDVARVKREKAKAKKEKKP
jgi:hypothetical protein